MTSSSNVRQNKQLTFSAFASAKQTLIFGDKLKDGYLMIQVDIVHMDVLFQNAFSLAQMQSTIQTLILLEPVVWEEERQ